MSPSVSPTPTRSGRARCSWTASSPSRRSTTPSSTPCRRKRRCVFPIKYFTNEWFENWSLTDPFIQKPIYLYLDYRAPVEKIREKFLELIRANDLWDQEQDEPTILVTELSDETMTVRLVAGGKDSSDAWYLSCAVREQMVRWLQQLDNGRYLPRQRMLLADLRDDPDEDE